MKDIYNNLSNIQGYPFISHMVQMKGDREFILRAFESTFISHMVQMKA